MERLFAARSDQVDAIAWTADQLRRPRVGETVTYVINRNINYTNQCYFRCGFCAFSKGPRSLNLREDPYLIPLEGIVGLAQEAWDRGATEVTLQGGIHPAFTGDFYAGVVEGIKARLPAMHIHGFTPLEIWQGAADPGGAGPAVSRAACTMPASAASPAPPPRCSTMRPGPSVPRQDPDLAVGRSDDHGP